LSVSAERKKIVGKEEVFSLRSSILSFLLPKISRITGEDQAFCCRLYFAFFNPLIARPVEPTPTTGKKEWFYI
jgi:hypothetical protein